MTLYLAWIRSSAAVVPTVRRWLHVLFAHSAAMDRVTSLSLSEISVSAAIPVRMLVFTALWYYLVLAEREASTFPY